MDKKDFAYKEVRPLWNCDGRENGLMSGTRAFFRVCGESRKELERAAGVPEGTLVDVCARKVFRTDEDFGVIVNSTAYAYISVKLSKREYPEVYAILLELTKECGAEARVQKMADTRDKYRGYLRGWIAEHGLGDNLTDAEFTNVVFHLPEHPEAGSILTMHEFEKREAV